MQVQAIRVRARRIPEICCAVLGRPKIRAQLSALEPVPASLDGGEPAGQKFVAPFVHTTGSVGLRQVLKSELKTEQRPTEKVAPDNFFAQHCMVVSTLQYQDKLVSPLHSCKQACRNANKQVHNDTYPKKQDYVPVKREA